MPRRVAPAQAAARFVGLLVLLGVAACTSSANTVCRTEIPVEPGQRLLIATLTVDGKPARGILDTGAQGSAVTDALVTRLGLLSDPRNGSLVSGVGGEGMPQNDALVRQFELAGFDPLNGHYPVIALPAGAAPGAEPLGALVGADVLSHFDIEIDLPDNKLVLYDPDRCAMPLPGWSGPMTELPLSITWSGRPKLTVKLDGHDIDALLDSGATQSVIDLPAAEKLGLSWDTLKTEKGSEGFGAAGVNLQRVPHTFEILDIGGETIPAPRLEVLDRSLREADMLLGLDWMRTHRVFISYRRHRLFIARPVGIG